MFERFYNYFVIAALLFYTGWAIKAYLNTKKNREKAGTLLISLQSSKWMHFGTIIFSIMLLILTFVTCFYGKSPIMLLIFPMLIDLLLKNIVERQIREHGIVSVDGFFKWEDVKAYHWYYTSDNIIFNVVRTNKLKQISWHTGKIVRSEVDQVVGKYVNITQVEGV